MDKRFSELTNNATDFANDDVIALDGETNGTRKMSGSTLKSIMKDNTLATTDNNAYMVSNGDVVRIKDLTTAINDFRSGDVIPVDGTDGTAKMSYENLLKVTAGIPLAEITDLRGIEPYAGDLTALSSDPSADPSVWYFNSDSSASTYRRIMYYDAVNGAWRYCVNNLKIDDVKTFIAIRNNAISSIMDDLFTGRKPAPIAYSGGITVITADSSADKEKVYYDNVNPPYRLMYWDEQLGVWSYVGNYNKNHSLSLAGIVGAEPYYGGLTSLNADADADKSKIYLLSVNYKFAVYDSDSSSWVYYDAIFTLEKMVKSLSKIFGFEVFNGSDAELANASYNGDKSKIYLSLKDSNPYELWKYGRFVFWSPYFNSWQVSDVGISDVIANYYKITGAEPYYKGGLTVLKADPDADTSKTYFVITPGGNYLKKMVYDSVNSTWVYTDKINLDVNGSLLSIISGIVGAKAYFGSLLTLSSDTTADTTKVYFCALASSADYLKIFVYDAATSSWTYGGSISDFINKSDESFNIENEKVRAYLDNTAYDNTDYTYTEVLKYAANNYDKPNGFSVNWEFAGTCDSFNVKVSLTGDFADGKTYTYNVVNTARSFVVKNLDPSKVAGVKVSSVTGGVESVVTSKAIPCEGRVRMLDVDGIRNVRDIGGWDCGNGKRIKYGKFFRGSAIDESGSTITSAGKAVLYNLNGVRAEIDLRSTASPTTSDIGASCVKYSITGYSYINGFNNTSDAYNVFSRVFTEIASGHPIYMHCSGGCDRTAFYVCMLEGLLGVSENDITKDFELSSFMDKAYSNNYRRYRSMGVEYSNRDWLGLITLIKGLTGGTWVEKFDTYFTSLGFTQSDIDAVRNAMLE